MKLRALVLLSFFVSISLNAQTLTIGIVAPLTGPVAGYGAFERDGALLAIQEWNAKGGVGGMKIVPIVEDDKANPTMATIAAQKLIQEDVRFLVGDVFSFLTIPISDVAKAAHVILITPISTNPAVTLDSSGITKAYVFRACFSDSFQGGAGAAFAVNTLKAKNACILSDSTNPYVNGLAGAFEAAFQKAGGAVVGHESYRDTDHDFSALWAEVKKAAPDLVYFPSGSVQTINSAVRQAREGGVKSVFLGGDIWDSPELDVVSAEGAYYTEHYWPGEDRREVQDFQKVYDQQYYQGRSVAPDIIAGLSYDATNVLLQAISAAGANDTDKVKTALEATDYKGVGGRITFNSQHDAVKGAVVMHVKDGKVVYDSTVLP